MTPEECAMALTYANQTDARIQLTDPTLDAWWVALEHMTPKEARWGISNYYGTANPNDSHGVATLQPATLRHRVSEQRAREAAKHRALEPPKNKAPSPVTFRSKDPERWDALVAQGAAEYKAGLRARGMEPHADSCPECSRPRK